MGDRLTGKASYLLFDGVMIAITSYKPKTERKLADTTDSGDYNTQADLVFPTQIPVSAAVELSVEGRYRKSSTPSALIATLYQGGGPYPVVLGLDAGTLAGHGNFDVSDFEASVPVQDTVTFTCTMKSNGQYIPNS